MTQPPHPAPLEPTCDVDQVAALISEAAGADTAATEAVVAALRRAQAARAQLVTQVPTEVPRQALLRQGGATS